MKVEFLKVLCFREIVLSSSTVKDLCCCRVLKRRLIVEIDSGDWLSDRDNRKTKPSSIDFVIHVFAG